MNRPQAIPAVDPLYADIRRRDPVRPAVLLDVRERDEFADRPRRRARCSSRCRSSARGSRGPARPAGARHVRRGQPVGAVTGELLRQGWTDVGNVAGGITAWERMGLPVRRGPVEPGEGELPG